MKPDILLLTANGWVPNNAALPVLHYHHVLDASETDMAGAMQALFERNGWPPEWRLMLGGEGAHALGVARGDVLVLPVGTGHCLMEASADFLVVGAYPPGPRWDLCREAPTPEMKKRMAALPVPPTDPVTGAAGALVSLWR